MKIQKENLQKPKAVLFDWDGTLVNTNGIYKNLLHETLKELGIESWDREAAEKYRFYSRRQALPLIFGDKWQEINDHYVYKVRAASQNNIIPFSQSSKLLEHLKQENIVMSVVSNKEGNVLRSEVKTLGWECYFHKVIGATDASNDKPAADPARLALQGINISNEEEVWFLGDSIVDVQCANAVGGIPILLVSDTDISKQIQYLTIPHVRVHSHEEIIMMHKQLK